MKLTKVALLAVLVVGLFAWVGFAVSSPPNFTIGWGYTITENSAPSFVGTTCAGAHAGSLTSAETIGTGYLSSEGDWTIRTNGDFTVTLETTIPKGTSTNYLLSGTWNPGFDGYNGDNPAGPTMEHIPAADQEFYGSNPPSGETTSSSPLTASWTATTAQEGTYSSRNTFISTLHLNMGINRQGLLDPADTYVTTVTITISQN